MYALEMKCTEDAYAFAQTMNAEMRKHTWNHYEMITVGLRDLREKLKPQLCLMTYEGQLARYAALEKIAAQARLLREACEEFDRINADTIQINE